MHTLSWSWSSFSYEPISNPCRRPFRAENYLVVACRRRMHTVVLRGRVSSRASDVAFGPFTVAAGSSTRIRFVVPLRYPQATTPGMNRCESE